MILADFAKALSQIGDRRFRRVFFKGIGLAIALLIGAAFGIIQLFGWIDIASLDLPMIGQNAFVGGLLSVGGFVLILVLSIFLMIPVASAITSMLLEDVAQAVEDRHYPSIPQPAPIPFRESVRDTFVALGVLVFANGVALALLPFFWFAAPFIFIALNGYLLGREYFILVAARHIGRAEAYRARRRHRFQVWVAGMLMAVSLVVPIMNLIVPILGAATFTHLVHRLRVIAPERKPQGSPYG